jgi:hypothetical protein
MKRTFTQICELLMLNMHYKNLCKRLLSKLLTQQLNPQSQEENERIFFFIYFIAKSRNKGKMMTRPKPRELKENSGLKRISQTESEHEMQKQSRKH